MIERLNFYDLYGYLLPGLIVLVLFWIPYGIAFNDWPEAALSSALLIALIGYITGHLVQSFAQLRYSTRFEYSTADGVTKALYPSDVLLDDTDLSNLSRSFNPTSLKALSDAIDKSFGIRIRSAPNLFREPDEKSAQRELKTRREAYFRCRDYLSGQNAASYAEQFHGLYSLMQGLTAAFRWASWYYLGWFIGMATALSSMLVGFSDPAWLRVLMNNEWLPRRSHTSGYVVQVLAATLLTFVFSQAAFCIFRRRMPKPQPQRGKVAKKLIAIWGAVFPASQSDKKKPSHSDALAGIAATAVFVLGCLLSSRLALATLSAAKSATADALNERISALSCPALVFAVGAPFCWISAGMFQNRIKLFAESHAQAVFLGFLNRNPPANVSAAGRA